MDTRQAASLLTKLLAGATLNTSATETDTGGNENNQDAGNAGNPNRNHGALKKPKRG
jgi:hypothetical protein